MLVIEFVLHNSTTYCSYFYFSPDYVTSLTNSRVWYLSWRYIYVSCLITVNLYSIFPVFPRTLRVSKNAQSYPWESISTSNTQSMSLLHETWNSCWTRNRSWLIWPQSHYFNTENLMYVFVSLENLISLHLTQIWKSVESDKESSLLQVPFCLCSITFVSMVYDHRISELKKKQWHPSVIVFTCL